MPIGLVDPATQPQGSPGVPASPLAGAFSGLLGAYGKRFPTPAEQAEINQRNAEAEQIRQRMGSGSALADTAARIIASQQPSTSTAQGAAPSADFVGPQPGVTTTTPGLSTGDAMRKGLPDIIRGAADSGDVGKASPLALLLASNLAGTPGDIANQKPGTPTTQDLAMMGAGQPYAATPGGVLQERSLGTPEMRNRNFKIQQIMQTQNATEKEAAAIVDGVMAVDPITHAPINMIEAQRAGAGTLPPVANTPVGSPVNNPGNLRPVGQTSGFRQFATPEEGAKALQDDLAVKLSGKSAAMAGKPPTLRNIITTYSPPTENNTAALIEYAAKRMQVDPDAVLGPQNLAALTAAITQQEQSGTAAHTAPAAQGPLSATASDLNVDFTKNYGGSGALNKIQSMLGALTNPSQSGGPQVENAKVNNMKSDYLGLAENRGRQSDKSRGYITSALPPSGAMTDMDANIEQATTGSGTAQELGTNVLNKVLSWREDDQRIANDKTLSVEARKAAQDNIIKEDRFIESYGSPDLKTRYAAKYGNAAPAKTNLQVGTEATTTAKTAAEVPLGKSGKPAPRTEAEYKLIDAGSLYEAPDGSIRTKGK